MEPRLLVLGELRTHDLAADIARLFKGFGDFTLIHGALDDRAAVGSDQEGAALFQRVRVERRTDGDDKTDDGGADQRAGDAEF